MQTEQGTMLNSLRTVQAFLDENAGRLAGVASTGARRKLDETVAQLAGHVTDQDGQTIAARGATKRQKALRVALVRDHMAPISYIAKAELPNVPELQSLRLPKGQPTSARLAAAAKGMAAAATPHADVFIAVGLPADFVAQLNSAADALLTSLSDRAVSRGRVKGATTGLKAQLAAGRRVVHILDAFVKSVAKDDAVLLANWKLVKRVPRTPGRVAGSTTQVPTPVPATAAA